MYVQPLTPPERFDTFSPPNWGMLRRSRCVLIFSLKTKVKFGENLPIGREQVRHIRSMMVGTTLCDHVPDWQQLPRILRGMVEARSVNVKNTTQQQQQIFL